MTESASSGAVAGVFATDADTIQLVSDTVKATSGDACVSSTGTAGRIEITGGVFAECGTSGASGGRAIAVSGASNTTLTVTGATLGGPNQTAIDFNGRDITVRGNIVVGRGTRTVSGFVGGGAIDIVSSNTATIRGNLITDHQGITGLLLTVNTLSLDSNIIARNRIGAHLVNWSTVTAADNDFSDHELLGVLNARTSALSMTNNWWGDARGTRRTAAPAATGDSVGTTVTTAVVKAAPLYAGTPASMIRIVRGDAQTAVRRAILPIAMTVRVTDDAGRPVVGTVVTFTETDGNGSVSSGTVTTNASGLAEVTLTLGNQGGRNAVRASFTGPGGTTISVTFVATAT
jgi:hypothetical protein